MTAAAPSSGSDRAHRSSLGHDVRRSLILSTFIVAATVAVEHTNVGQKLERAGYDLLQTRLKTAAVPITIVDISRLRPRPGAATPRGTLREAIDAIADQAPRAIGVDIDFSPDEWGYLDARDPEFFRFCLDTRARKGVPVFLGVGRTVLKPPRLWLGDPQFRGLAAQILTPRDNAQMLLRIGDEPVNRSMGALLADAYLWGETEAPRSGGLASALERWGLAEKSFSRDLGGFSIEEIHVDYGALDVIRRQVMIDLNPIVLRSPSERSRFEGNVVLLGDTEGAATDHIHVRGHDYPGVMFHASAAYTLLAGPLYTVTPAGRLAIDITCILAVLLVLGALHAIYRRQGESRSLAEGRLHTVLTILLLLLPAIAGILLVRATRLLWSDFLLTGTALLIHPRLERHLANLGSILRTAGARLYRSVMFERESPR
jgi:hypothetical protein